MGIAYQDLKERLVYWFLFPLMGIFGMILFYHQSYWLSNIYSSIFNLILISSILGLSYTFMKYRYAFKNLKECIGLGDILFFVALSLSFPTISFLWIIIVCFLSSIICHQFIKLLPNQPHNIPLAGYSSLALVCILFGSWFGGLQFLYTI